MVFVNTKEARHQLGVHANTLRRWANSGKIRTIRSPGGRRLYDVSSLGTENRERILYARVSSKRQKADLKKQTAFLRERYPGYAVIEDFGSGLNFKRKGLATLLERIMSGAVEEVVVAHRDRLCRFGFDLIESVARHYNTRIVVLDNPHLSPQEELVRDILSIIHVFSCRIYGLRKYGNSIKKDTDIPQNGIPKPA